MTDTTTWTCGIDPASGAARLAVARSDQGGTPQPFAVKGVCYSPAPINGSNGFAPAIGDWFWDAFPPISGWDALWARDLPRLRALGANTIRVYAMLSRQLNGDGTIPDPWNGGHLFTHQRFLDACWDAAAAPAQRQPEIGGKASQNQSPIAGAKPFDPLIGAGE